MGHNNRYNPTRDKNEPDIVEAYRASGRHVTLLNGAGVTDLLVLTPSPSLPIYVVRTIEEALLITDPIALVEVKSLQGGLTDAQVKWHNETLLKDEDE